MTAYTVSMDNPMKPGFEISTFIGGEKIPAIRISGPFPDEGRRKLAYDFARNMTVTLNGGTPAKITHPGQVFFSRIPPNGIGIRTKPEDGGTTVEGFTAIVNSALPNDLRADLQQRVITMAPELCGAVVTATQGQHQPHPSEPNPT